jgi:exodeoxyribonuclease VII large subunit
MFHTSHFNIEWLVITNQMNANHKIDLTQAAAAGMLTAMIDNLQTGVLWTVTDLSTYIRKTLEKTPALQDCWVRGEISNLSQPASGHIYFSLKDSGASIRAVIWRGSSSRLGNRWVDGADVLAHGKITTYPVAGNYQLVVDEIHPVGEGVLYQEYLKLKARLEAEGLFDPERKRALPEFPCVIGLVTSATGAAVQDMLNTIRRRFPLAEVALCPTMVQGAEAPTGIIRALKCAVEQGQAQVVIVARGGGSIEDLWAFNDEQVVRAIAACPAPVVTGIGHETDFTLADFAADVRAATPTAAAELVTPDRTELLASIMDLRNWLDGMAADRLRTSHQDLTRAVNRLSVSSPAFQLQTARQRLDEQHDRLTRAGTTMIHLRALRQAALEGRLKAINPAAVIQRGFAIVTHEASGALVTSPLQVAKGDTIRVTVRDGSFHATGSDEIRRG